MDRRRPLQTLNGRLPLKLGSDRPQTLPKRVSDDPRHFIFRLFCFSNFLQTSKFRLPPKDGSDRPQTLPKRVSYDSQRFIFRRLKKFLSKIVRAFGVETKYVGDRLKRVLAKFEADRSHL